jgi:hypothetical protein
MLCRHLGRWLPATLALEPAGSGQAAMPQVSSMGGQGLVAGLATRDSLVLGACVLSMRKLSMCILSAYPLGSKRRLHCLPQGLACVSGGLRRWCRASDALDSATARLQHAGPGDRNCSMEGPSTGSASPAQAISYLEEQLRKAAAEVAEIEERLL